MREFWCYLPLILTVAAMCFFRWITTPEPPPMEQQEFGDYAYFWRCENKHYKWGERPIPELCGKCGSEEYEKVIARRVSTWLMRGDEQIRGSFKTVYEEKS